MQPFSFELTLASQNYWALLPIWRLHIYLCVSYHSRSIRLNMFSIVLQFLHSLDKSVFFLTRWRFRTKHQTFCVSWLKVFTLSVHFWLKLSSLSSQLFLVFTHHKYTRYWIAFQCLDILFVRRVSWSRVMQPMRYRNQLFTVNKL